MIVDSTDALAKRYGIRAFPTSFVLDADEDIRQVEVGYTTEFGLRARMWLAGLWRRTRGHLSRHQAGALRA